MRTNPTRILGNLTWASFSLSTRVVISSARVSRPSVSRTSVSHTSLAERVLNRKAFLLDSTPQMLLRRAGIDGCGKSDNVFSGP